MGEGVSTDFKSSNRIEIPQLVQVLLNFDWFWGSPLGGGGVWMGVGMVRGCPPHTCMHGCAYRDVHARACAYDIIGNSLGFPQWGQPFAWNYHVYHTCVCMHACGCMCTCVWGTPNHPLSPSNHPPPPRVTGSPKHQNSITLELIEIIRFCLKILYLWTFLNSYRP